MEEGSERGVEFKEEGHKRRCEGVLMKLDSCEEGRENEMDISPPVSVWSVSSGSGCRKDELEEFQEAFVRIRCFVGWGEEEAVESRSEMRGGRERRRGCGLCHEYGRTVEG